MDIELLSKLACIHCGNGQLQPRDAELVCGVCEGRVILNNGIPDFFSDLRVGKLHWDSHPDPKAYERFIFQCDP